MSTPELTKILKENAEHDFAYDLGEVVFLKTDQKFEFPMLITDFITDGRNCCDYEVSWLNLKGTEETGSFPEECLILKK